MDDRNLIRSIRARRDEAAFRRLVERHGPTVFRVAHSVTRDRQRAEDVTQETFFTASRKLSQFDASRSFRAWLLGIAYRHAIQSQRSRARSRAREESAMDGVERNGRGPVEAAGDNETVALLTEEVARLPDHQRALVALRYQEGLTFAEAASVVGIRVGTAKSRVHRALEALRDALSRRGVSLTPVGLAVLLENLPRTGVGDAVLAGCVDRGLAGLAMPLPKTAGAMKVGLAACVLAAVGALAFWQSRPDETRRTSERRTVATRHDEDAARRDRGTGTADGSGAAEARDKDVDVVEQKKAPKTGAPERKEPTVIVDGKEMPISELLGSKKPRVGPDGKIRNGPIRGKGGVHVGAGGPMTAPGRFKDGKWVWNPVPKFASPPRHYGSARVAGRVVDASGAPLPGAKIYRLSADAPRAESTIMSGRYTDELARSGADGAFKLENQKAGRAFYFADYKGRMIVPGTGIDTKHAVAVQIGDAARVADVVLKVPVVLSDLVALSGVVRDSHGRPVPGAAVWLGTRVRVMTRDDGTFDFGRVDAGSREFSVKQVGMQDHVEALELAPKETRRVEVVMHYHDEGELRLAGQVVDMDGKPVAKARLYLGAGSGTVREQTTDASGNYVFDKLPDVLAEMKVTLHVWPTKRHFGAFRKDVDLSGGPLTIRLYRAIEIRVTVRSAADGRILQQLNHKLREQVERDGKQVWIDKQTGGSFRANGVIDDIRAPVGKPVRLMVEAPGHEVWEQDIDTDVEGPVLEMTLHLQPATETAEEEKTDDETAGDEG